MTVITFLPDNLALTFRWETRISKSHTGLEHRVCGQLYPSITVSIDYTLGDDDALRDLRLDMFVDPGATVEIPFRHEAAYVTADVTSTTVRVPISKSGDWAIAGRRVYVEVDEGEDGYAALINSVSTGGGDNIMVLNTSPPSPYRASVTRVCPLITVQPEDGAALGNYRLEGGKWTFTGKVSLFAVFGTDVTPSTFASKNLWDLAPDHAGEPQAEGFESGLVWVGDAPFEAVTYRTFSDIIRSLTFSGSGLADWQMWKALLADTRGQQVTFLMPTWQTNFTLFSAASTGDGFIYVNLTPDIREWLMSAGHQHLWLMWSDGTVEAVTVDNVNDNITHLQVEFTPDMTGTGTLDVVSLLELTRLDSDEVTVTHEVGGEFSVALQTRSVQQ